MAGHVFHPGHHELHGITVVVHTAEPRVFVGRFDRQDESGVHLIGVSAHDSTQTTEAEFLSRTIKFGVRVDRPHLVIPADLVRQIIPLGSLQIS